MIANSMESVLRLQKAFWVGVIALAALFSGYFLAANAMMPLLFSLAVAWLLLFPYHAVLSVYLALATFTSALIMPFFPGRPYLWEFAALLGWSGLLATVFLRKYLPDSARRLWENKWLLAGVIGYCAVLVIVMMNRGFGLRILGSEQMGGRFYFQQLACAVFPFLFLILPLGERTLTQLYCWQCFLTCTFLISDFVFSTSAGQSLYFLLQFFELPGDAVNFEMQAMRMGIRRYQSLHFVCQGFILLTLIWFKLEHFLTRRALFLLPWTFGFLGIGLLSGHRYLVVILGLTVLFMLYSQRFFNFRNALPGAAIAGLILVFAYGAADRMPLAAQRAISFLPGISVARLAKDDARGTLEIRSTLRKIGMEMARDYLWVGRGFGQSAAGDYSLSWDPTAVTAHVNQGRFYNGFVGLLVNTGVFGTFFMMLFLGSGTILTWKVMLHLRAHGCEDNFSRICSIAAGLWMANVVAFLFLHGDSEFAMKTFSLQAGFLMACHYQLRKRLEDNPEAEAAPA